MAANARITLDMEGIVQGVGFRPAMQRLAEDAGLCGWVQNRSGRVRMQLDGPLEELERFIAELPGRIPRQARLDRIETRREPDPDGAAATRFVILESESDGRRRVSIPADLASCSDCLAEVFDPDTRFFGYPFTTCTNCGPRYTVVREMPYDRERTSLAAFPLCPACQAEYENVRDRRFHAESIACPACGPRLTMLDAEGKELPGAGLAEARRRLAAGDLLAVKGLGGFLLAADLRRPEALRRLRERKRRPDKPFALMARSLEVVERFCHVPEGAAELLASPEAPIVILALRDEAADELPTALLSPDTKTLGVMLPTTPLHVLLATPLPGDETPPFDLLVMTSGNRGGEPIAITNEEAVERLAGIADAFVVHDRPVLLRNDDSLVAWSGGAAQIWRRARGYAPRALPLATPLRRNVLAMGAELKNTLAFGTEQEVVLSPHIGDLETPEALDALELVAERLPRFLGQEPVCVAVDLHPDMHATRLGRALAEAGGLPVVEVQHHHAHAAAGLLEYHREELLALVFDGTGLGPDGAIWGAELLHARRCGYTRLGTFAPAPLLGGDAAVRQPARQAIARWLAGGVTPSPARLAELGVTEEELAVWQVQHARGLNCPMTHAAGRVFDAYAAALGGAPAHISYEGQAAIRLEALARRAAAPGALPPFALSEERGLLRVDWREAFAELAETAPDEGERAARALAFHHAVAEAGLALARHGRAQSGLATVLLTGGVFMNRVLSERLSEMLEADGFEVLVCRTLPPNDGGVAAGQVLVAGGAD